MARGPLRASPRLSLWRSGSARSGTREASPWLMVGEARRVLRVHPFEPIAATLLLSILTGCAAQTGPNPQRFAKPVDRCNVLYGYLSHSGRRPARNCCPAKKIPGIGARHHGHQRLHSGRAEQRSPSSRSRSTPDAPLRAVARSSSTPLRLHTTRRRLASSWSGATTLPSGFALCPAAK